MNDVAVGGVEFEVAVLELAEALREEGCADEEHEGERGLKDDERALRQRGSGGSCACAAAKGVGGLGLCGDPCGSDAEEDAGDERERDGEADDGGRGRGIDGDVGCSGEGEREQHAGSRVGDDDAGDAAECGEDEAFGEELPDDAPPRGAEGGADGHLGAAGHAANEQQIGDVGAGDEQDESGDPGEQMQVRGVPLLHGLDPGACGGEGGVGFGELFLTARALEVLAGGVGLAQEGVDLLLELRGYGYSGLWAADDVEPALGGVVYVGCVGEQGRGLDGEIEVWRGAGDAVAEEALGGYSDDGDGAGVDPEGAADD